MARSVYLFLDFGIWDEGNTIGNRIKIIMCIFNHIWRRIWSLLLDSKLLLERQLLILILLCRDTTQVLSFLVQYLNYFRVQIPNEAQMRLVTCRKLKYRRSKFKVYQGMNTVITNKQRTSLSTQIIPKITFHKIIVIGIVLPFMKIHGQNTLFHKRSCRIYGRAEFVVTDFKKFSRVYRLYF